MAARVLFPAAILLLAGTLGFAGAQSADDAEGNDEPANDRRDLDAPGPGDGSAPNRLRDARPSDVGFPSLWTVGWVLFAAVAGMVIASSLSKVRPVPFDPLVTAPGAAVFKSAPSSLSVAPVPTETAFEAGRDLAYRAAPATVDHALRLMGVLGLGLARLGAERPGEKEVRLQRCASCEERREGRNAVRGRSAAAAAAAAKSSAERGCAFEAGFLRGAFEVALGRSVRVEETQCGGGGSRTECAFRVRY